MSPESPSSLKKYQESGVLGTRLNFTATGRSRLLNGKSKGHGLRPNDESSSMNVCQQLACRHFTVCSYKNKTAKICQRQEFSNNGNF